MYTLWLKVGKDTITPLARGGRLATFTNLFTLRKYLRVYDKSLLTIIKV